MLFFFKAYVHISCFIKDVIMIHGVGVFLDIGNVTKALKSTGPGVDEGRALDQGLRKMTLDPPRRIQAIWYTLGWVTA
ncbi:hypothetical protein SDJN03_07694, partial [Cucurbita argyrosperma subsp. sororia]